MPFPDSGNYAALGFAEESGLPFEMGMIRNHYVGRTFIQPSQAMRDFSVRIKLNPVQRLIADRKIVIVEDSIVRGTTSRNRVRYLRECGAARDFPAAASGGWHGIAHLLHSEGKDQGRNPLNNTTP